jgi:hypothetical protein
MPDVHLAISRGRGRPKGAASATRAPDLNFTHFAFLRGLMEGLQMREAWERYLSHEEGIHDVRSMARRARELVRQVKAAGEARGLQGYVQTAFRGFRIPEPPPLPARPISAPDAPASFDPPLLDDWIEAECRRTDTDPDFYSYAEWQELYFEAVREMEALHFGEAIEPKPAAAVLAKPPLSASDLDEDRESAAQKKLAARIGALNVLGHELENPPRLDHRLDAWLSASLARSLAGTQFNGRPLPLQTIGDLITFVNMQHHRWWRDVPRLGPVRANRVLQWLRPVAEQLERPLYEIALVPLSDYRRQRDGALALIDGASETRFGMVPLDRLAVPPELDGSRGQFRGLTVNTLGALTDLEAIRAWLRLKERNETTAENYARIVERFYLWCMLVKRKALSDLDQGDILDFKDFAANPPASWVQRRKVDRGSAEWRPFKGKLAGSSLHLNMSVIGGLMKSLTSSGYLAMNAATDVARSLAVSRVRLDIDRSFDSVQWAWLMRFWDREYRKAQEPCPALPSSGNASERGRWLRAASLRRTRLVLELGSTTGLRLQELLTTRHGALQRTLVDGQAVWLLKVIGKGSREREVVVFDDIVELIRGHLQDRKDAGVDRPGSSRGLRALASWEQAPSPALPDDDSLQPLVGILRKPPAASAAPSAAWPGSSAAEGIVAADAYGSLDPTALHQALKRFLQAAADAAEELGAEVDTQRLRRASAHWLRHFFANSMAADDVSPAAMKTAMGHSSLATTSVYLRPERKLLVAEMGKLKRRT